VDLIQFLKKSMKMKRIFYMTILFVAVFSIFVSCKDDYENTIANLKEAIIGETNARAKYLAFADKADEENYRSVANLFRAAAAAENIHLRSHNKVLEKMGEPEFPTTAATPTVNSTAENLQTAIYIETHEYTMTYPGFVATAEKEKCNDAVETFKLANLAEENHSKHFSTALTAIESGNTAPLVFFVCMRCGGLFTENFTKCRLCQKETDQQYYKPLVFDAR